MHSLSIDTIAHTYIVHRLPYAIFACAKYHKFIKLLIAYRDIGSLFYAWAA